MSLKDMIEQWSLGVARSEAGQHEEAVDRWTEMAEPGARIYYNISSMFLKLGNLEDAERNLSVAVKKDPHLALAYFQRGCLHLQKSRFSEAMLDFEATLKNLRGNLLIDYKQLGMQYKLYSCEVMYNRAYALSNMGRMAEARKELEDAKRIATDTSESRHKIIASALEHVKSRSSFLPYKLPEKALVFHPPKNKTESMKPINFLGKAKVISSVVDQDSYVGFVGVQDDKLNSRGTSPHSRSPSPKRKGRGRSPSPSRGPSRNPRMPKPDIPPPAPDMKIRSRTSSLGKRDVTHRPISSNKSTPGTRPSKPDIAPPAFHPEGNVRKEMSGPPRIPVKPCKTELSAARLQSRSPSPKFSQSNMMTVKVHYSTTRAIRMSSQVTFDQLQDSICKKFSVQVGSLTLWSKKKNGDLREITDQVVFKEVIKTLDDGFRLTLWAYDKHESSPESEVVREVTAVYDYEGQYEDELSFKTGDKIMVTVEINNEWCEGTCRGSSGIFPLSYVQDA